MSFSPLRRLVQVIDVEDEEEATEDDSDAEEEDVEEPEDDPEVLKAMGTHRQNSVGAHSSSE